MNRNIESTKDPMILDHIENIVLTKFTPLRTNTHSLYHLKEGIFMTYKSMIELEKSRSSELMTSFSFDGTLTQEDARAVCLMHWYSITLVNFVNCIGLILFFRENSVQPQVLANNKELKNKLTQIQREYRSRILELQPVLHFRHKAAAHLAYTDPSIDGQKPPDNPATLIESMSIIPSFENGRYFVGRVTRHSGEFASSFSNHPWSLTENFESLIERFFKDNFH